MNVEYRRSIGTYLAPVVLSALLGLAQINLARAQNSGYSVARYDPVAANIAYRLNEKPQKLLDRYCGDPTIDGYIALNEKLVGRELGSTIGEIWYIQETDPESDKQVLKGCAIDVAAASDVDGILSNGERPANQILDASIGIFGDIDPNRGIVVSHEDPRRNNNHIGTVQPFIINNDGSQDYDFLVTPPAETVTQPNEIIERPEVAVATPVVINGSPKIESEPGVHCQPGKADAQGKFELECKIVREPGTFSIYDN